MLSKKFNHDRIKGEKKSQKNKDRSRFKETYKHENSGKGSLLIPEFMEYVSERYADKGLEAHHFYGSSMGKFDCFITVISSELHAQIHHGANECSVKNYVDMRGERILIVESMVLFQRWLDDALTEFDMIKKYQPLVDAVLEDVYNAVDIARNFERIGYG